MAWVEVPVPADIHDEVKQFVASLGFRDSMPKWDPEKMDAQLSRLAPDARELCYLVADRVASGTPAYDTMLAEHFDMDTREVHGLVQEVNVPETDSLPSPLLWVRHRREGDPPENLCDVYMLDMVAALVRHWRDANVGTA